MIGVPQRGDRTLKTLKWLAIGAGLLLVLGTVGLAVVYQLSAPEPPPAGSASAGLLEPGPYPVGETDMTLVDTTRPTPANGKYAGADSRRLETTIWYPQGEVEGGMPLVIYAHGFMSDRYGGSYLARALASRGYVVASADFPLTSMNAPGGPNAADVVNQPGDVSFLIDSVLALNGADKPFDGEIEPSKIGVMGLSLGGLTATLVGYHRRWRDPRLRAVVSIAGPAAMFTRSFFLTSNAPLLMVAGTQDAIVDYEANAAIIPERAPQATLLTIRDGAHTSFVSLAEPAMRFMNHPDSLGCDALTGNREEAADDDPFAGLGDMNDGINPDQTRLAICNKPLGKALHPGRQQMIAEVGVVSFFQFQFGAEPAQRLAARKLLQEDLPRDLPEASITHGD